MTAIKLDSRQITKGLIIIGTVLTLIYTVHLMTSKKEKNTNSYFNTPNPTNQKIMTVNQSTGEINFLDKSVKTLNDNLVNDYATLKDAMVVLLGENLRGDTEGKIYELSRDKASMTRVTDIEDELDGRIKMLNCGSKTCTAPEEKKYKHHIEGVVHYGHRIDLKAGPSFAYRLGDDQCNNHFDGEKAQWCKNPSERINIKIVKG